MPKTKKVPIPPKGTGLAAKIRELAEGEVGSHFDWKIENPNVIHTVAASVFDGYGHITVRALKEGSYRVWRVK